MDFITKYRFFKEGIVKKNISEKMQELFKTELTEKQILLLQDIEDEDKQSIWGALIIIFLLGAILGMGLTYLILKINYILGFKIF